MKVKVRKVNRKALECKVIYVESEKAVKGNRECKVRSCSLFRNPRHSYYKAR